MGAQAGAGLPDVVQGNVPAAVAKSAMVGNVAEKVPFGIGELYNSTAGRVVPLGFAGLGSLFGQ